MRFFYAVLIFNNYVCSAFERKSTYFGRGLTRIDATTSMVLVKFLTFFGWLLSYKGSHFCFKLHAFVFMIKPSIKKIIPTEMKPNLEFDSQKGDTASMYLVNESILRENDLQPSLNQERVKFNYNSIVIYTKPKPKSEFELRLQARKMLEVQKQAYSGMMSETTTKYVRNILQHWLKALDYYNSKNINLSNKRKLKPVFVTLTLPSEQRHSDKDIKRVCLDNFIKKLKYHHHVKHYFWRAETQGNGNIHFHILFDKFIDKALIKQYWNDAVELLDYVTAFQLKHGYVEPSTTRIEVVSGAAMAIKYVCYYTCKNDNSRRKVDGAVWGMSDDLRIIPSLDIPSNHFTGDLLRRLFKSPISRFQDNKFTVFRCNYEDYIKWACVEVQDMFNLFYKYIIEALYKDGKEADQSILVKAYNNAFFALPLGEIVNQDLNPYDGF